MNFARLLPVSAAMLAVAFSLAAQAEPMHVRGTLTEFDSDKITVAKRDGGVEPIAISQDTKFLAVKPIGVEQIKPGSYIGVAGTPRKDGSIKALGVMVFPPSMKGVSEGHFPWDLQPGSTMTNATVAEVEKSAPGREVVVKYKGGSQRIWIADSGNAVASFEPASSSILKDGAKVTVVAQTAEDGLPIANAVLVGENGFTPPN